MNSNSENMNWKNLATKIVSLLLIAVGLYQVFLSLKAIFFIYPQLGPEIKYFPPSAREGLIEKAIILYASMLIDGAYGTALLLKPSKEIKAIHLLAGLLIAIASIFFVTKTSLTTDPVIDFLLRLTS